MLDPLWHDGRVSIRHTCGGKLGPCAVLDLQLSNLRARASAHPSLRTATGRLPPPRRCWTVTLVTCASST